MTYGPGRTTARVTNYINFQTDSQVNGVIDHMAIVSNSEEFERHVTNFKYFRIIGVKVIVPQRQADTFSVPIPGRITYDWVSNVEENVLADDGGKEISNYQTGYRTYRFAPPNMIIQGQNGTYNYKNWNSTNYAVNLPGWLKISAAFSFNLVVETYVEFRGNQTQVLPNVIKLDFRKNKDIKEIKLNNKVKEIIVNKEEKENEEEEDEKELNKDPEIEVADSSRKSEDKVSECQFLKNQQVDEQIQTEVADSSRKSEVKVSEYQFDNVINIRFEKKKKKDKQNKSTHDYGI